MSKVRQAVRISGYEIFDSMKVNWSYWKKIPECDLYEAVYLALGIEPKNFKLRECYEATYHTPETDYFIDRLNELLDIAYKNLSAHGGGLKLVRYNSMYTYLSRVKFNVFREWFDSMGFDYPLPDEFPSGLPLLEEKPKITAREYFDRSDFPPELKVAFLAWVAIAINNECPDKGTPKQRLEYWIKNNHPDYAPNVVNRVATVANWMKEPGRTKKAS